MYHRILIVAAAEGFIIKGLETKLKGIGCEPIYSPFKEKELEEKFGNTDVVIIFTDDSIGYSADSLAYIKDRCSADGEQIIVIGTKEEYSLLKGYIPESLVYRMFERPLDMEDLITALGEYMTGGSQEIKRKNILIVDDDVAYMSIIMEWLKDKYRVFMANSAMKAITWLANNHADLLLLDYEMPITSGPQVLEMIRSDARTAKIPVMFLTGKSDKESIMKVLALKPVGYQLKTIDKNTLRENIEKFFATHEAKE
ncbi:MAG: response regulator [Lachnospiraceae bacterium]|nr:response regulator [Lachnospiraceae bacterium]